MATKRPSFVTLIIKHKKEKKTVAAGALLPVPVVAVAVALFTGRRCRRRR